MKKLTESQKLEIYKEFVDYISQCEADIQAEKQPIPWAGTKVGPVTAVTLDCVSYQMGKLRKSFENYLRIN